MGRWPADARMRLEKAALELFVEHGFAETTVPQITARAGLTTRTFFRHFVDKREVLFAYDNEIPGFVAHLLADAPASYTPMEVLTHGLAGIAVKFESERDYLRTRRGVLDTDESLRERELRKQSVLSEALRRGFLDRGFDDLTSTLSAHIGVSVFSVGLNRWLDDDAGPPLLAILTEILDAVVALTSSAAPRPSASTT